MGESNNGESLSEPHRHNPKRHNAKLCPFPTRQEIVNALANGDSVRAIARALHVSNNTVVAVQEQEWQQVAARKGRLAAQAERNALMAGEQIAEALAQRKYPPSALVPVYGVSIDKALALRGDASLTLRHEHTHRLTDDDILAFAVARSKQIQAQVIDTPSETSNLNTVAPDTALHQPKPNPPNISGNGNLSRDGPPAALTDETTEQRESPGA